MKPVFFPASKISKWELSEEELKQIQESKSVYLWIYSNGMPPVSLTVNDPWDETKG
jgi:hypothetical protein